MRKTTKIMNLATALGALVAPTVSPGIANATDADEARLAEGQQAELAPEMNARMELPRGADLMAFTVYQNRDGMMVPKHGSHYSHASHASHHSSSY